MPVQPGQAQKSNCVTSRLAQRQREAAAVLRAWTLWGLPPGKPDKGRMGMVRRDSFMAVLTSGLQG